MRNGNYMNWVIFILFKKNVWLSSEELHQFQHFYKYTLFDGF